MRRRTPLSDVEYTGLTDTAVGFSGSSTLDSSVDIGSALPLVTASGRNQPVSIGSKQDPATFTTSTYDLWDMASPSAAYQLSGVSDPPFASANESTPFPNQARLSQSATNAVSGQSKFGSAIATLMGNHSVTQTAAPSTLPAAGPVLSHAVPVTGSQTAIIVVLVIALGIVLLIE